MRRVAVVGGGNAALCAAISASEYGADVVLYERAPYELRGGNSRFTAGAIRAVYGGSDDLLKIMPDLTEEEIKNSDFGEYSSSDYFDDLGRITNYRCDPDLAQVLISESFSTLEWMHQAGVRFLPLYGRQSFQIDGKHRFWGGLTIEAWGGGEGLIESLSNIAKDRGIELNYSSRITDLKLGQDRFYEVEVNGNEISNFDAVVLACGGFESSAQMRARYLGPNWDLAKVRGTRFNTGDGIRLATKLGAATTGHWSGCHAVAWDLNAPEFGDLDVGDGFQKHSYPYGIVVNANGERFLDEGADFRNYTYAKYGKEILNQPNQLAWQVFDNKVEHLLRDEYRIRQVTKATANTLEELAEQMVGVSRDQFLATVSGFNSAVDTSQDFDPTQLDGRSTTGLRVNKSNWANTLDTPPYLAFGVTCGVTFTFGGLKINSNSAVLDEDSKPIPGLFAAGELAAGLFYGNYPGGTGLASGATFGRIAGRNAVTP